jgi:hypothetical protein
MSTKPPKVVVKKLGREKALGIAYTDHNEIHIDPRHRNAKSRLDTEIHEFLHIRFPDWSETKVMKEARAMREFLWGLKYRKVSQ